MHSDKQNMFTKCINLIFTLITVILMMGHSMGIAYANGDNISVNGTGNYSIDISDMINLINNMTNITNNSYVENLTNISTIGNLNKTNNSSMVNEIIDNVVVNNLENSTKVTDKISELNSTINNTNTASHEFEINVEFKEAYDDYFITGLVEITENNKSALEYLDITIYPINDSNKTTICRELVNGTKEFSCELDSIDDGLYTIIISANHGDNEYIIEETTYVEKPIFEITIDANEIYELTDIIDLSSSFLVNNKERNNSINLTVISPSGIIYSAYEIDPTLSILPNDKGSFIVTVLSEYKNELIENGITFEVVNSSLDLINNTNISIVDTLVNETNTTNNTSLINATNLINSTENITIDINETLLNNLTNITNITKISITTNNTNVTNSSNIIDISDIANMINNTNVTSNESINAEDVIFVNSVHIDDKYMLDELISVGIEINPNYAYVVGINDISEILEIEMIDPNNVIYTFNGELNETNITVEFYPIISGKYMFNLINTVENTVEYTKIFDVVKQPIFTDNETIELTQKPAEIFKNVEWVHEVYTDNAAEILVNYDAEDLRINNKKLSEVDDVTVYVDNTIIDKTKLDDINGLENTLDSNETNFTIAINEPGYNVITYETEAPQRSEQEIGDNSKLVSIYSDHHYFNVKAYTDIPESKKEEISLYWLKETGSEYFSGFDYVDTNNNGLIDRIEWVVPHLSNQTFLVEINVLNVQSYPIVEGNWTVKFNTTGVANLTIRPYDGTRWSKDNGFYDVQFLDLRCGNKTVDYEWIDNSVFVEDYSCNETSYETSKVFTEGKHDIEFLFGNLRADAHNFANVFKMEWGTVDVTNEDWSTVTLSNTYVNPIVVVTPEYKRTIPVVQQPRATIARNVTPSSFEVHADEHGMGGVVPTTFSGTTKVHYVVMEEGIWTMPGTTAQVEAGRISTTKVGYRSGNWNVGADCEVVNYAGTFTSSSPVVLHARTSDNNNNPSTGWADAWVRHVSTAAPAGNTGMCIGLDRGAIGDAGSFLNPESLDYIVIDEPFDGSLNGKEWEATTFGDIFDGWDNFVDPNPPQQVWSHAWSVVPGVIIPAGTQIDGSDGYSAVLYEADINNFKAFTDEFYSVGSRAHTPETLGAFALEGTGSYQDNTKPYIYNLSVDKTNITGGTPVKINVSIEDEQGNETIDAVNVTIKFPNFSEFNVSLSQSEYSDTGSQSNIVSIEQKLKALGGIDVLGETGTVDIEDFQWHNIAFNNYYSTKPVVVATVVSDDGSQNAFIPTISSVNTTHVNMTLCQDIGNAACAASTTLETVHYYVMDPVRVADYDWIDIGWNTVQPNGASNGISWNVAFANTPYVFMSPNTYNQVGTNMAATYWLDTVSTVGANLFGCTHQGTGDSCDGGTPNEEFAYIAIDPIAQNEGTMQTGTQNIGNSAWTGIGFAPAYTTPRLLVGVNTESGGQDPVYPGARNLITTGADIRYCEQDGANDCDTHNAEGTRWMAVEDGNVTVVRAGNDVDANSTEVFYSDVSSLDMHNITKITINVDISHFNNSGSTQNGNSDPELTIDFAKSNMNDWTNVGTISPAGTGIYSLVVTDSDVMSAWYSGQFRDIKLKATKLDYFDQDNIDELNWDSITFDFEYNMKSSEWFVDFTNTTKPGLYNVTHVYALDKGGLMNMTLHDNVTFFSNGTLNLVYEKAMMSNAGKYSVELNVSNEGFVNASSVYIYDFVPNYYEVTGLTNNTVVNVSAYNGQILKWEIPFLKIGESTKISYNLTYNGTGIDDGRIRSDEITFVGLDYN